MLICYLYKQVLFFFLYLVLLMFPISASMSNMAKIEEMERLLKEARVEKQRLLEHRVICPNLLCIWICVFDGGRYLHCAACVGA